MTKEQLIDYANRSIYGNWASDSKETMDYLTEFIEKRTPEKLNVAIQLYAQLPEEMRRQLIQAMIKTYCKEFNVNTLNKLIQTPFGNQFQIIKYTA